MAETKKPANPLASVSGIVGAAGGWAVSHYTGVLSWIPAIASILLLLLFTKTPLRPRFFLGAITITGGHVAWFMVGCLLANLWAEAAIDLVALSIGILWLWFKPNLGAVLFLGLIQLGSLAYNVFLLSSAAIGSVPHKALTVHCLWRLMAIAFLISGYIKMRRERLASLSPPPALESPENKEQTPDQVS